MKVEIILAQAKELPEARREGWNRTFPGSSEET